jgi:hypothetical protein
LMGWTPRRRVIYSSHSQSSYGWGSHVLILISNMQYESFPSKNFPAGCGNSYTKSLAYNAWFVGPHGRGTRFVCYSLSPYNVVPWSFHISCLVLHDSQIQWRCYWYLSHKLRAAKKIIMGIWHLPLVLSRLYVLSRLTPSNPDEQHECSEMSFIRTAMPPESRYHRHTQEQFAKWSVQYFWHGWRMPPNSFESVCVFQ